MRYTETAKKGCCVNHSKAHLQSQRDGGQSQVESGSAEPPEFVLDGDAGYGCLIWEIRKKRVSQSVGESFVKSSIVSVVRGCFKKKKKIHFWQHSHHEIHMRKKFMLTTIKGLCGSFQNLQCESSNYISLHGNSLGPLHSLCPKRGDHLGPVNES